MGASRADQHGPAFVQSYTRQPTLTVLSMADAPATPLNLAEHFPPTPTSEWHARVARDLGSQSSAADLHWAPAEGVTLRPFYRTEDLDQRRPPLNRRSRAWTVVQPLDAPITTATVEEARTGGAEALALTGRVSADQLTGMPALTTAAWDDLLQSAQGMRLHLRLEDPEARTVAALRERLQTHPSAPAGLLLADPMAAWAVAGAGDVDTGMQRLMASVADAQAPNVRLLGVDATMVGEAGGSAVHQIGYALAGVSEYLAAAHSEGIDPGAAANHLHLRTTVGTSYPLEVGSLRALRLLLPDVLSAYDAPEAVPPLVASVAERPLTAYAPYTNMLRGTTAAAAAIVGGCDALIVQPYDALNPEADALGRRIARNTQLILRLESHLGFVEDPAAGSYYLEALTQQLAEAAWAFFQDIEAAGGLRAALRNGLIQDAVATHASQQAQEVDERERILVGATHYPDMNETRAVPPAAPAEAASHPLPDDVPRPSEAADEIRTLVRSRLAADVEQLRYHTDQYAEAHGHRPKAALLPIGPRGMRAARATFSRNYLGCAGLAIHESTGYADVEAGLDAAEQAGADLLVLCSSDEAYRTLVPDLAAARDARGLSQPIVVAGYPADDVSALRTAGAAAFIHRRAPLLDTLSHLQSLLGIS